MTAQNLVPNYSFETISFCPETFGGSGPTAATPWIAPTQGTADIFNVCNISGIFDVPDNIFGNQDALTGVGYAGGYTKLPQIEYREYLSAPLDQPLIAGEWYAVSFYVSPGEIGCSVQTIGAYFSVTPPTGGGISHLNVDPQIESDLGFMDDYANWTLISGCFQAAGGEQHITLGNFYSDAETENNLSCSGQQSLSYYYYEDVVVMQGSMPGALDLELNGPETACFEYEIDPGIPDVNYTWEDGSQNPTLVVTESGVYSLTISDGCNYGVDSIEIIINGNHDAPDLGPPQLTLCAGDVYEIILDPELSEYEWQDGSNDPDYTITTAGTYSVTLDDGCAVYTDEITIFYMDPPAPFSLGDDAILCVGDEVDISFDPSLGDFLWQDDSTLPTYTVSTGGTYSLTISNMCGMESDEIEFTDLEVPEVEIGDDDQTLCDGEILEIQIDPDLGDILWQDGSTEPNYEIVNPGLYIVSVTNQCGTGSDQVDVTINQSPDIDLGPDTILCDGETLLLTTNETGPYLWQDNSTENYFLVSEPGTYLLTIANFCGSVTDEIIIFYMDPPAPFNLGDDAILCVGDAVEYSFDPSLGEFLWHDNSSLPTYTVSTGGIYSLTITNMCGMESDEIEYTDLEVPEVEIGPDEATLCDGEILEIEIDPDLGDILWQDGSAEPNYEIVAPGLYTVFVTNECGTGSDQVDVTVIQSPDIDLGPDTILCGGETLLLTTNETGPYLWQDNSTENYFLVSGPGIYSLTISNFCGSGSDAVNIGYTSLVTPPGFGPDVSLCPGEQFTLYANNPGAEYLWQDFSTADSFVVNSSGTYTVRVFNSCSMEADTIVVTVNDNPPQVDLPAQLNLCQGLSVTLDAAIFGVNYLWNDNSQNQQLLVNAPGTYSVTVSNTCGMDADTTIIIDGGPAPSVALGNDVQLCSGDQLVLSPLFSNVDAWLWQDDSVTPGYTVNGAGTITVEVSNACGSAFDTLIVNLLPATPPLNLGPDTSLCAGEQFILSINTPGVSVLWPDGSNANDFIVDNPGFVFASIANGCGISYDTIQVIPLPDIPTLNLGPDQSLCPGEVITLSPGIPDVSYLWLNGSTNISYQSTQEETIILTISNSCGSTSDTLDIFESTQGPQVDLGPDIQVCQGEVVTITSSISGVNYLWQDGSSAPDFSASVSGTFILAVSNNCGVDSDTITVDISGVAPSPFLGPDTTLCEGLSLVLLSSADPITSVLWQDGSSSPTFTVSSPGTYTLAELNRCGDAADTMVVNYLDGPDPFTLGPDTTLCPGESITLSAPSTAFEITWQDGSTQPTIIADQALTYSLQLSNDCGVVSDNIVLDFDTRIPLLNLDPSISWCEGDIISLDATQSFIAGYLWSDGSSSATLQVTTPGLYSIEVTTPCSTLSQEVDVFPGTDCVVPEVHDGIYLPNVFSPNGDGINDVFNVSFESDLEVTSMAGTIFDRWGNLVYGSKENPFNWDGFFNDELVMPGVYVYVIQIEYLLGGFLRQETLYGDVTIVR